MSATLVTRVVVISIVAASALAVATTGANSLFARQAPGEVGDPFVNLPEQCTDTCQALFDFQCDNATCGCTSDAAQLLSTCLNCIVGAGGDRTVAQASLDAYRDMCASANLPIDPVGITSSPTGSVTDTGNGPTPTDSGAPSSDSTTTPPTSTAGTTTTTGSSSSPTSIGTSTSTGAEPSGTASGSNGALSLTPGVSYFLVAAGAYLIGY